MGYLFAIGAVCIWGMSIIPIKLASAPGRVGVMVSMPVGAAVLFIFVAATGNFAFPSLSRGDWVCLLITGLCEYPLGTYTYYEAVKRCGITVSAPMTRLTPLIVVVVSMLMAEMGFSTLLFVSALMVFAGGGLLGVGARTEESPEARRRLASGIFYAFLACVFWAVGNLFARRVCEVMSPLLGNLYALGMGAAAYWLLMLVTGRFRELNVLKRRDVAYYSAHGVMSFALGYTALFLSIPLLGVSLASVITGTWPAVSVVIGFALFREPMNVAKLTGIVLLIASAVLAGLSPR
jgi:drug/metabolite transporter (DMT)-like permease